MRDSVARGTTDAILPGMILNLKKKVGGSSHLFRGWVDPMLQHGTQHQPPNTIPQRAAVVRTSPRVLWTPPTPT